MDVVARIREERVVALLRRVVRTDEVVDALVKSGIHVVELTLDDPGALAAIERLRAREDVAVAAGTVRTPKEARQAVDAGAEALVSPALVPEVLEVGRTHGIPVVPGALTPTEIETAWRAGAALVKLFPARLGGPQYVADVLKPLAGIPLVCTGGVTAENAASYLASGAAAVGVSFTDAASAARQARRLAESVRSMPDPA